MGCEWINEMEKTIDDCETGRCQYVPMSQSFRFFAFPVAIRRVVYREPFEKFLHMHDFPQVWYCLKGSYRHTVDGIEYICREGSLLTVPPGKAHWFSTGAEAVELICLECTFYFLKQLPREAYVTAVTHLFCPAFEMHPRFFSGLYMELGEKDKSGIEALLLTLCAFDYTMILPVQEVCKRLGELYGLSCFALSPAALAWAEKVIDTKIKPLYEAVRYCNHNYLSEFGGDDLAKVAGMCRSGFYAAFKKLFGITYANYRYALRMYRVRLLLEYADLPLNYISDMFGFSDSNYMRRLFKRYYGVTLSQFRQLAEEKRLRDPKCRKIRIAQTGWERINIE